MLGQMRGWEKGLALYSPGAAAVASFTVKPNKSSLEISPTE